MHRSRISVVIPSYNESGSLTKLITRLDQIFSLNDITYEVIVVDDHSTDNTKTVVMSLAEEYPVHYVSKQGKQGKATALIQGFNRARYSLIAMIDADLQYPPENIVPMMDKINEGSDVVVGNRVIRQSSLIRSFMSVAFHTVFVRWLHGLDVDSQSGLKVFKKSILERFDIESTSWSFDLEFLIKAREAGYLLDSYDIEYLKRETGVSKVNLINSSIEIGLEAIKLKLKPPQVIPFARGNPAWGKGFHYKGVSYVHYNNLNINETAIHNVSPGQRLMLTLSIMLFTALLLINWREAIIFVFAIMIIFYFSDVLFNLVSIVQSFRRPRLEAPKQYALSEPESNMPRYTIFCPLYKEWQVLGQFLTAIKSLDYPKNQLQVLLLLEENDAETIKIAKKMHLPPYVDIIVVPHTLPKTKPKACNYGLQFATGEFAVIYDAEDVPDPLQLRKAVSAFRHSTPDVKCVQAKLNFYNPHQNLLTRFFATEYSLWFGLILPGLQTLNMPLPLGGTSNHFRVADLKTLKGWDAFNVTEDADLGIRLATKGYKTIMIDSITLEEANSDVGNWLNQRTRWLKGYLQTYLVHMRQAKRLIRNRRLSVLTGIQLVIGGKVLALLINPFMWIISILYFTFRPTIGSFIESFFPPAIFYLGVFSFVIGNFLYLYYYMIAAAFNGYYSLVKYAFLVPLYWLAISLAAWKALYGLIVKPHYWFKTTHGLHLKSKTEPAVSPYAVPATS